MSDVLILGASARAAIHSARRAGLTPHAADLFADRDATAYATVRRCDLAGYPDGLERLADTFEPMPWLYTGGLENHPELVDRIAAMRPLLGNAGKVLRSVRGASALRLAKPSRLQSALGLRDTTCVETPRVVTEGRAAPDVRWVRKAYTSSGGVGVSWATDLEPRAGTYLQEFAEGDSIALAFCADNGEPGFLGGTEQLVGTTWLHAAPFRYAGSIGPRGGDATHAMGMLWGSLSRTLRKLRHAWGADLILKGFRREVLIEINPRYTASMEVLEHATGRCALDGVQRREPVPGVVGKAVYYAPHAIRFPEVAAIERAIEVAADPWALPEYADIPAVGSVIDSGQPVLSFFERAVDAEACRDALKRRAAELDALFARHRVEVSP